MLTRREFLASSASAGVGLASAAATPSFASDRTAAQAKAPVPYIGYVSVRRDNRISIFTMDPGSGKVAWQQQVRVEGGPDPMDLDPRGRFLYVACRDRQQLSSYRIDPATGGLSLIITVPLQGEPIQIVTDRTGRYLLSVFFYQSTIGVHALNDGGKSRSRRLNGDTPPTGVTASRSTRRTAMCSCRMWPAAVARTRSPSSASTSGPGD